MGDDADGGGREKARKMWILTFRFACRATSQLLVRNIWDTLWLRASSDIGRQVIIRGNINAITELLTFLVTPIITSLSDAYGRRPGQFAFALCNLAYQLCGMTLGLQGKMSGLIAGQFFFSLAFQGQTLQRASMGDLYMSDPVDYTGALGKMELCYPCSKMSMPLLAAAIITATGQLEHVYYLSTCLALTDCLTALLGPETLPDSERKPFRMKTANPLSFLKMFTSGRKLRLLGIVQFLGDGSDSGYGTDPPEQIANLHRSTTLAWSVPQRAQWDSINALIRVLFSPTVSMGESVCDASDVHNLISTERFDLIPPPPPPRMCRRSGETVGAGEYVDAWGGRLHFSHYPVGVGDKRLADLRNVAFPRSHNASGIDGASDGCGHGYAPPRFLNVQQQMRGKCN